VGVAIGPPPYQQHQDQVATKGGDNHRHITDYCHTSLPYNPVNYCR
jgi:hypothetical protein